MWGFALRDVPLIAWYIGVLVLIEGLLSADNALVLAVMVRHLPKNLQRRVLFYGIWGAVGFRLLALSLSSILLRFWICKVLGGGYLLYLAAAHFWSQERDRSSSSVALSQTQRPESRLLLRGFWGTVTSITMADIAFSVDSILAAVAMAEGFPNRFGYTGKLSIVFVGGVLGIITMRFVVRYFLILLDRFPGLAEGAYYLVAWIGLKLLISGLYTAGWCDLRLMSSVKEVSDIPTVGKDLIIVAAVDNVLHFRMFDGDGKVVVDTDEKRLPEQARQIEDLRKQLVGLWPPHELTRSEKGRVTTAVTSIIGHIPPGYIPFHIPEPVFWAGMLLIAVVSLLVKPRAKTDEETDASERLELLESDQDSSAGDRDDPPPDGSDGSRRPASPP